jgi:KRAB domain-containing zinc finger protein
MRVHSGEKPFTCRACKKQFADKSAFRRHEATHSQDKKMFECSVCKKEYTDRSTCKRHESEKHGIGKVKKCPECGKEFSRLELVVNIFPFSLFV